MCPWTDDDDNNNYDNDDDNNGLDVFVVWLSKSRRACDPL